MMLLLSIWKMCKNVKWPAREANHPENQVRMPKNGWGGFLKNPQKHLQKEELQLESVPRREHLLLDYN